MKSKSMITHLTWGAIAATAFWVGTAENERTSGAERDAADLLVGAESGAAGASSLQSAGSRTASGENARRGAIAGGADWRSLARQVAQEPSPVARMLAFSRLLETLTPENALAIRGQLVELGVSGNEWRDFNYAWGALAGEDAFAFAAQSEERDLEAAFAGWASADPAAALAMFNDLPEALLGQRDGLARSLVEGMLVQDRAKAVELVFQLAGEGGGQTGQLMQLVADSALRADGVESAARWSESLPEGPLRVAAMQRIAGVYVRRDPVAAARWVEAYADQSDAAGVVREVGAQWARQQPVEAVSWLESLPEGPGQVSGLNAAFGDWEDRDPTAATEYLSKMEPSAQRDAAISGFSRGYAWQDPEVALVWALDISDPKIREESLTRVGQIFLRRNPESARTWIEASDITPATQQAIFNGRL